MDERKFEGGRAAAEAVLDMLASDGWRAYREENRRLRESAVEQMKAGDGYAELLRLKERVRALDEVLEWAEDFVVREREKLG